MRLLSLIFLASLLQTAESTSAWGQGDEGFSLKIPAATEGDERSRQNSLWVMEVHLKPLRLIWVDRKNPVTGEIEQQLFHYVCYRAVNRPLAVPSVKATEPVNQLDPEPGPPFFIPEFTLVAEDADGQATFLDQVLPDVQQAINLKERRTFKNSVTISSPLPAATQDDLNNDNSVYGVAIFQGLNPEYDRLTLYLTGFSNGYYVGQGPDGEDVLMRKSIMQKFWRPGDRFDPASQEYRFVGEPVWMYRPDALTE